MPDREKVIKAWECCNPFNRKCKECPYEKDCYHDGVSRHMVADAVALLKEQETVKAEDAEMSITHNDGTVEYVKDIADIMLLAHKDYGITYCGTFAEGR